MCGGEVLAFVSPVIAKTVNCYHKFWVAMTPPLSKVNTFSVKTIKRFKKKKKKKGLNQY